MFPANALLTAACLALAWPHCLTAANTDTRQSCATFRTRHATFGIGEDGALCELFRHADGRRYLAPGQPAPLLSARIGGKLHAPVGASWEATTRTLTLRFSDAGIKAVLSVESKPSHVVFELLDLKPANGVELILWGPYPTTISNLIGEVVGVVRDAEFAIGLQALNARTLGGHPSRENDIEAEYTSDDSGNYPDLPVELKTSQLFRGDTARRTEFGSVLQAYCRQRDRDRVIANWGHDQYLAPAFPDGGVRGSKIALFGCPAAEALPTIGAIEIAEGLPHPLLDGVWAKTATNATCSYLIVDFSEATIVRAIAMTRRAGLTYLYHSSPFETWGHFKLKPNLFPGGWDGLRTCVEKARQAGVRIGFHTLSNFITPNDPYVTPKPDPRLARVGASVLTTHVNADQQEIPVAAPDYFRKPTPMNAVVVGDELIRYGSVSAQAPWRLLECQRGAWGTRAAAHAAGRSVARLMDHDYKVFLTDANLGQEVARHIARLCNHAGTLQISLDGLEGNWSTGMGQYGRTLFTKAWYDALAPELRGQINDASNPGHFNWHINTRMNWGEPWYAGFRESQTLYRFKNQLFFERNLLPRMLGWFALRPDTSLEDAEWLLARAAGFDAGFALAASLASTAQLEADPSAADAAREFGATPAILSAVREWETARLQRVFPPDIKALLRDNAREFHLRAVAPGCWDLFEIRCQRFTHDAARGVPTEMQFAAANGALPSQWLVRSGARQPLAGLSLEISGRPALDLGERPLPPGGSVKYSGGPEAVIYDATWKEVARVSVDAPAWQVGAGRHSAVVRTSRPAEGLVKIEYANAALVRRVGGAPNAR
jgi:hypothetical protein